MKTIICSDIHLTAVFEEAKYAYLEKLFSSCDQLIINGDFWDGYETTFTKFSRSAWKELFPLMKQKNAIYLYGNHDKEEWTKDATLFSMKQVDVYTIQAGKAVLHIEHGHRIAPSFDMMYPKLANFLSTFFSGRRFRFAYGLRAWENIQMKQYAANQLPENQILVCGHSHIAEFNKKRRFINLGAIDSGIASYVLISGSNIKLVLETYG